MRAFVALVLASTPHCDATQRQLPVDAALHDAAAMPRVHRLRGGALNPLLSYRAALATAPITTNVVSAAALSLMADGMAQTIERRFTEHTSWDVPRSGWIALWGASISGLMLFFWFQLLSRLFPLAAQSTLQLIGKVALNQVVMSPGLNAGFFSFVVLTRVEPAVRWNANKAKILKNKLKMDLPQTIRRSCYFWSCAQTINFRFMPLMYNTLWTNACFLIWTTYISWVGFQRLDGGDGD